MDFLDFFIAGLIVGLNLQDSLTDNSIMIGGILFNLAHIIVNGTLLFMTGFIILFIWIYVDSLNVETIVYFLN